MCGAHRLAVDGGDDRGRVEAQERVDRHVGARAEALPAAFVNFMKTLGRDKVCFATDYPLLQWDRVLKEVDGLGLRRRSSGSSCTTTR